MKNKKINLIIYSLIIFLLIFTTIILYKKFGSYLNSKLIDLVKSNQENIFGNKKPNIVVQNNYPETPVVNNYLETSLSKKIFDEVPAPVTKDYIDNQKSFDYLISYADNGFFPKTINVESDKRIRFTNNSTGLLKLSLPNDQIVVINPKKYFEISFSNPQEIVYTNILNSFSGKIQIK